jgi:hypothetical protein
MINVEDIQTWTTQYPIDETDTIPDMLRGRVLYAISDQITHMIYDAEIKNPDEVKKIIMEDVKSIIESYKPQ